MPDDLDATGTVVDRQVAERRAGESADGLRADA
jgi:hypothetical protein